MNFPYKLSNKLKQRNKNNSLRVLSYTSNLIDFYSNDYLGFASNINIFNKAHEFLIENNLKFNGSTGSRLLSGNNKLYEKVEKFISDLHNSESALIFNSGYSANIGFFSSVLQRGDLILYDEYIHASIRDGIMLSNAKSFKFQHNNLFKLEQLIIGFKKKLYNSSIYVVTESVFSMDGDTPDLKELTKICNKHNVFLIVDEAHAFGVFKNGLIENLNLQNRVFARIITYGKALGCHGAVILASKKLINYLVNFARSFIYTTSLSYHSLAVIKIAYNELLKTKEFEKLQNKISFFNKEIIRLNLNFIKSNSAIHCCIIGGNIKTIKVSKKLQNHGFNVKPILSPTVKKSKERLRFCIHSYNSNEDITRVLELLSTFV